MMDKVMENVTDKREDEEEEACESWENAEAGLGAQLTRRTRAAQSSSILWSRAAYIEYWFAEATAYAGEWRLHCYRPAYRFS